MPVITVSRMLESTCKFQNQWEVKKKKKKKEKQHIIVVFWLFYRILHLITGHLMLLEG